MKQEPFSTRNQNSIQFQSIKVPTEKICGKQNIYYAVT